MNTTSPCFDAIAKYFISNAATAYYCDLRNETVQILQNTDIQTEELKDMVQNFNQAVAYYATEFVHPDDRHILYEYLDPQYARRTLKKASSYSFDYREDYGGRNTTFRGVVVRGEDDDHVIIMFWNISLDLEKKKEAMRLVDNITAQFNIVYLVDMSNDSLQVLRMDSHMLESKEQFRTFSQARDFFLDNVCHFRDRGFMGEEMDFATMRKKLKKSPTYNVEYRVLKDNVTMGGEMSITALEGERIIVGMAGNDLDLVQRHMQTRRYNDYFALFVIDLDTEMLKVMKKSPWYKTGDVGQAAPYSTVIKQFAQTLEPEPKAFFMQISDLDYVRTELAHEDKHTYSYRSNLQDNKWVSVVSYVTIRHEDGTPAEFTLGFSLVDSMESRTKDADLRIREDMHMIGGLANGYLAVYYVNIDEQNFKVYSIDNRRLADTKKLLSTSNNFFELFHRFAQSDAVHPEDRHLFMEMSVESVRERLAHSKKFTIRFRCNYGQGYLWSEMNVIKYEAVHEQANAIIIGFAEVNEIVQKQIDQEMQLKEALSMAQSANKAKTTFLNNMSHDIRTPMNAIIGFTGLAMGHIDEKSRVLDYLGKIEQSSNHLLSLINDVLDMSRIESGKMNLEEKPENLSDIIGSLRDMTQADIQARNHKFIIETTGVRDKDIICDRLKLNQVLLNILSNSIKYTPQGGTITMRITEKAVRASGYALYEFRIKDNGMGMGKEYLSIIFEPFTRVKSTTVSGIQGTGLGMAITKNIVDMMGGKIEVRSVLGKGTETVVTFDFRLAANVEDVKIKSHAEPADITGCKVLLVEDNELNREIATAILEELGCIVTFAQDGDIAVSIMKKGKEGDFDLVLMDIQMPTMDGYEATRQIRALGTALSHIPIIAMTANAFEEDRKAALEAGMDEHLAKPVSPGQLTRVLAEFIKKNK